MVFLIIAAIAITAYFAIDISIYNKTCYKMITKNSYFTTMRDKGRRGEYETYRCLRRYENKGCKFLFNVYLPKSNGKSTELDAMMISPWGVFVFESKNYSGWIFGDDRQKNWTQVLPVGRGKGKSQKEHFYNPVWQNRTHCNVLKEHLPQDALVYSVVLFSNRCTFKDVTVNASDVVVVHRREVGSVVSRFLQANTTSTLDVNRIYETLYPFSQVSETEKQAHVEDVKSYKQ